MRILSITAQKPHSTGSGIYLTELVNNWRLSGHEQAVVAGIYEPDKVLFPEEVKLYPVYYKTDRLPFAITGMSDEMPYESTRYQEVTEEMLGQFREVFYETVSKAVEELKPDLIICHHLYLLTAMLREWYPDKKIIGICHGSDLRQICKNPLKRDYIKKQIGKLDGVTALQEDQKKEIQRIFGILDEKIAVVGAGYNQNIFCKGDRAEQDFYQLVFAGKVSEKKGVFSLLRALERLPYASDKLVLKIAGGYGNESEYQEILELAENCKYPVEFLGVLNQSELAEVLRQSDVFVLPSFFEGLPLVTMEAMACGCKVVCSEIAGLPKWFDENVPGHKMEFVPLPKMHNSDEPEEKELPIFERRLAEAIEKKLEQKEIEFPDLEQISWKGISKTILKWCL